RQRRRASCTRLRSRRYAGWRLTPYPGYGALYIKRLLTPQARARQRRRASCTRLRSRRYAGWRRAASYPGYGSLYIKRLLNTVGPRKRSAAGQAVPDSVPVVVPDDG
ncbi:hypothetical protein, partial [Klebsiella pneumoniae]